MNVKFVPTGTDEIHRKFESMAGRWKRKTLRSTVTKGSRVFLDQARKDAKLFSNKGRGKARFTAKNTGLLAKSLASKVKTKGDLVTGRVAARNNPKTVTKTKTIGNVSFQHTAMANPAKYLHLVILGTKPHSLRPKSKAKVGSRSDIGDALSRLASVASGSGHPGSTANPFLNKSYEMKREAAIRRMQEVFATDVVRIAAQEQIKARLKVI